VWESQGFPLKKAQSYVRLTKPFLVNDVFKQDLLLDRRLVYRTLSEKRVPLPPHIIVNRTQAQVEAQSDPKGFEETEDYVSMVRSPMYSQPRHVQQTRPLSIMPLRVC
jgi:inositol-hexakisphosphate/diphosphoinositol-pentakisphosphate 1-kinase